MKTSAISIWMMVVGGVLVVAPSTFAGWSDNERCPNCGKMLMKGLTHSCKKRKTNVDIRREKAGTENPQKILKIDGFCGHAFHEVNTNGENSVGCMANKKYFGGYDKLELKYSASAGLYSISAVNDDSFAIKDVEKEILRMVGIFEKRFRCTFASEISSSNNATYGERAVSEAVCDSVTGGIRGYKKGYKAVLVSPATEAYYVLEEKFKNITITFRGTLNYTSNAKSVRCTVELTD